MAICPICKTPGDLCAECPNCHKYCVEADDLRRSNNDELLGDIIGDQYIPLSLIGEGGMGKIFKAKAKYTGKIVALKILKPEYMEDETLKDRFFREAEVVAALDHPNIVKLYSCAPDMRHNTIFMAMELLQGRSLFELLRAEVPTLETVLRIFSEIASALGEAHKHGIFHRDMKPENVFIQKGEDGLEHAKVLDFGFARLQGAAKKLTMAGVAFGTPHYMSPEQAMGLIDINAAVDVYAMGIMLFQAISGHVPFNAKTAMEVMYAQVHSDTPVCEPRPEYHVNKRLLDCIYKCMKKEPASRFPDGNALHDELVEITKSLENEASTASDEYGKPTVVTKAIEPAAAPSSGMSKMLIPGIIFAVLLIVAIILIAVMLK